MQDEAKDKIIAIPFVECVLLNARLQEPGNMQVEMMFRRDPAEPDEINLFSDGMEEALGKNKYFTMLFDASNLTQLKFAAVLKKQIDAVQPQLNDKVLACATVLPPGKVMDMFRKFFIPKKSAYPVRVCKDIAEAREFLRTYVTASAEKAVPK